MLPPSTGRGQLAALACTSHWRPRASLRNPQAVRDDATSFLRVLMIL